MCSTHTPIVPDNNALSNSLHNNLFLDGFNSSPGWLLVTRTRGAWWCRYRGHCRSGPRHLSPRSRVCAQQWYYKDIHSHSHSHTPLHTPKKRKKQQQQNTQLTEHDAFVYWSSSCPVGWWATFTKLGTCSTSEALSPRTVRTENICESVQQILQHSPAQIIIAQLTQHDAFVYWSSSCPMRWMATARKLGGCSSAPQAVPRRRTSESALKNGIIKTFTHTAIPIHPCTLLKNGKNNKANAQLTEHDAFVYWSFSCPVGWWATFRKLGSCSTSEALSPRTVRTENICESVQQILQHSPAQIIIAQLTQHDAFVYWSSSCPMCWRASARKLGECCSGQFHVGGPLA